MMDEYLVIRLARDRASEMERDFRQTGGLGWTGSDRPSMLSRLASSARQALTVRDLGRLAIVSFFVMLLGIGVVGLFAAATEHPTPAAHTDLP